MNLVQHYIETLKRYPQIIAFGLLASFFSSFGQTFFFGLYGEHFRESFNLSHTSFGGIYSGVTLCGGIIILFLGHFIDKVRTTHYAAIVLGALSLGCFLIYSADTLTLFILGLFLVRFLGQGMMSHMSSTVTTRYIEEGRGYGLTITSMGHPIGNIIFPAFVMMLLGWYGWQETWLFYSVFCIVILLPLFIYLLKNTTFIDEEKTIDALLDDQTIGQVLRQGSFWVIIFISTIMPFLLTGVFFHQQWIVDNLNLPTNIFAYSLVMFGISSILCNIVAGHITSINSPVYVLRYHLVPFVIASLLLLLFPSVITFSLFIFCASFTAATIPARGTYLAENYGTQHLGAIKSIIFSSIVLASALSPFAFGMRIDTIGTAEAIIGLCMASTILVTLSSYTLRP
jgi:MFS family permease